MSTLGFVLVIAALIAVPLVLIYNHLIGRRQMVDNGWSDIDVQLKRRADLIPNLVEVVKAYAQHERALFVEVTEKRNQAVAAGNNPAARSSAEAALARPVSKLMAVAEDYPELKANQNFLDLQKQLAETEDTIEMARRFYNGAVRELNIAIETVPSNIVAGLCGFQQRAYFEIESDARAVPEVKIGDAL